MRLAAWGSSPILGIALVSAALPAFGLQPLITDDTGTQGSGNYQGELATSRQWQHLEGTTSSLTTVPLTLTYGFTETADLFVQASRVRIHDSQTERTGSGNPVLGIKWRFYEIPESKLSLGLKPELWLPVSEQDEASGLGYGRTSAALTMVLSRETAFGAVHFNLAAAQGRSRDRQAQGDVDTLRASLAPLWDLSEQWKVALDAGIESVRSDGARQRSAFVELAGIYLPHPDVELALGVVRAADNSSPRMRSLQAILGLTLRFR